MTPPIAVQESQEAMIEYYRELFGEDPSITSLDSHDEPELDPTLVYEETIFPGEGRRLGGSISFDVLANAKKPGDRLMDSISQAIHENTKLVINSIIRSNKHDIRVFHVNKGEIYERLFTR